MFNYSYLFIHLQPHKSLTVHPFKHNNFYPPIHLSFNSWIVTTQHPCVYIHPSLMYCRHNYWIPFIIHSSIPLCMITIWIVLSDPIYPGHYIASILETQGPPSLITTHSCMPECVALSPRADNLDLQLLPPSLVQVLWGDSTWGERGPGHMHQNSRGQNGHKSAAAQESLHQQ